MVKLVLEDSVNLDFILSDVRNYSDFFSMSPFVFTYYAMTHPDDNFRCCKYLDNCPAKYQSKVMMWISFFVKSGEN